jgi:hypothetical protein
MIAHNPPLSATAGFAPGFSDWRSDVLDETDDCRSIYLIQHQTQIIVWDEDEELLCLFQGTSDKRYDVLV